MNLLPRRATNLILALCAVCTVLTACGGDGGGNDDPEPTVPLPPAGAQSIDVAAAWRNTLTGTGSWTTTGTAPDNTHYELNFSIAPGAAGTFSPTGFFGSTSIQSASIFANGAVLATTSQTVYFDDAGPFGVDYGDGTCSSVGPQASAVPTDAAIGSSGSFPTETDYDSCSSEAAVMGTTLNQWSVESDSGVTLFCILSQVLDANGANLGSEQDCVEASADGTLGQRARVTVTANDTPIIVTRNF